MWMGYWPDGAIFLPWDLWIVTWMVAALWSARTVKRPNRSGEMLYRVLVGPGYVLLLLPWLKHVPGHYEIVDWPGVLGRRFWMPPLALGWTLVGVAAAGFLFAWWARIYLGRLWSGAITRKEGHNVVDKGPYGIVRHPIYTGIFVAVIATVVVSGTLHAVLGGACLIIGYWLKARLEERFLREELGADAYDSYRRRVPMLIPFGPKAA
jgi:protein-S-isoprenylcysteine O-methyltransferase Ste14